MTREYCYQCRRAKVACLCGRIEKQPNNISVIVLQHPDEVSNPKGSAIIAELGLELYQHWVGEDFSQHQDLQQLVADYSDEIAVLYPAENAEALEQSWLQNRKKGISQLIVIDATWRKAKKIWELTPALHDLAVIKLSQDKISNYRIRKVPKDGYLSTVECIVEGLRLLESRPDAYQPLLGLFDEMIDFQIGKMGGALYRKNYLDK